MTSSYDLYGIQEKRIRIEPEKQSELIMMLLACGADPKVNRNKALREYLSFSAASSEVVKAFCNKISNLSLQDEYGCTALHDVIISGIFYKELRCNAKVIKILLNHGIDPNLKTKTKKETALHWAAKARHRVEKRIQELPVIEVTLADPEIVDLLCTKADVNIANSQGNTALHFAAKKNFLEVAEVLLKHNANRNLKNNAGHTPLQLAEAMGADQELIDLLKLTS